MTVTEIMAALQPSEAGQILEELRQQNRPAYRGVAGLLASRRKLRVVFLDKKPIPERHAWMAAELIKKSNGDIAAEILQAWLFACHKPMLCEFLNSVGVKHDGEGLVESLPEEPPNEVLQSAIDGLLAKQPAWVVMTYLNLFCGMDISDWPRLGELVATHPALANTEIAQ